jgi:hypothetical protein
MLIILGIFIILLGMILQGMHKVPNNPPHKALITLFGKLTGEIKEEGWRFFFLRRMVFDCIEVNVEKRTEDFSTEVTTPDNIPSDFPISYVYEIYDLVTFLKNKGDEGVKKQVSSKLTERAREWAASPDEGPATWEELRKSQWEAVSILIKAIGLNHVAKIPDKAQKVPTFIWLRYFENPRPSKAATEKEKPWIGDDGKWTKVEDVFKNDLSDIERKELKEAVENRRDEIKNLRSGSGKIEMKDLGVRITSLNIGKIKVEKKIADAAEGKAQEEQERLKETYEVQTDLQKAKALVEALKANGEAMSLENAYRIILEWKTTREGHGFTIPGLTPTLVNLVSAFLGGGKS